MTAEATVAEVVPSTQNPAAENPATEQQQEKSNDKQNEADSDVPTQATNDNGETADTKEQIPNNSKSPSDSEISAVNDSESAAVPDEIQESSSIRKNSESANVIEEQNVDQSPPSGEQDDHLAVKTDVGETSTADKFENDNGEKVDATENTSFASESVNQSIVDNANNASTEEPQKQEANLTETPGDVADNSAEKSQNGIESEQKNEDQTEPLASGDLPVEGETTENSEVGHEKVADAEVDSNSTVNEPEAELGKGDNTPDESNTAETDATKATDEGRDEVLTDNKSETEEESLLVSGKTDSSTNIDSQPAQEQSALDAKNDELLNLDDVVTSEASESPPLKNTLDLHTDDLAEWKKDYDNNNKETEAELAQFAMTLERKNSLDSLDDDLLSGDIVSKRAPRFSVVNTAALSLESEFLTRQIKEKADSEDYYKQKSEEKETELECAEAKIKNLQLRLIRYAKDDRAKDLRVAKLEQELREINEKMQGMTDMVNKDSTNVPSSQTDLNPSSSTSDKPKRDDGKTKICVIL